MMDAMGMNLRSVEGPCGLRLSCGGTDRAARECPAWHTAVVQLTQATKRQTRPVLQCTLRGTDDALSGGCQPFNRGGS